MNKHLETLLVELASLGRNYRVVLQDAKTLLDCVDRAIQQTETTMFDLHAASQEQVALQIHNALVGFQSIKGFAEEVAKSTDLGLKELEVLIQALIWSPEDTDDAAIEGTRAECRSGIDISMMMQKQIHRNIELIEGTTDSIKRIGIFATGRSSW